MVDKRLKFEDLRIFYNISNIQKYFPLLLQ